MKRSNGNVNRMTPLSMVETLKRGLTRLWPSLIFLSNPRALETFLNRSPRRFPHTKSFRCDEQPLLRISKVQNWEYARVLHKSQIKPGPFFGKCVYIAEGALDKLAFRAWGLRYCGRITHIDLAEFIYNHIVCAPMVLWLAEASGIPNVRLSKAKEAALSAGPRLQAQSAAIRKIIPWKMIEAHLDQRGR